MKATTKPIWKEKDPENLFYFEDGKWVKCDENKIQSLWEEWVKNKQGASVTWTEDGFYVYGYKETQS